MIKVINIDKEPSHSLVNFYYIGRKHGNVLGNPFTHLDLDKTSAIFKCRDREEAIEKYDEYYDIMYGHNIEFTSIIDEIYNKYKNGEEVTLGCHCKPLACHGDIIKKKLEERLFKEKISNFKNNKK